MSIACHKDYTLQVKSSFSKLYWTMDETPGTADRVDKFQGLHIKDAYGPPVIDPAGLYGNAIRMNDPVPQQSGYGAGLFPDPFVAQMAYKNGQGISFWCWAKANNIGNTALGTPAIALTFFDLWNDLAGDIRVLQVDFTFTGSGGGGLLDLNVVDQFGNHDTVQLFPVPLTLGLWQLFQASYNPTTKLWRIAINNGAWTNGVNQITLADAPFGDFSIFTSGGGQNWDWSFDEVGLVYEVLSDAQWTQIYNGGSGVTWPAIANIV